MYKVIVRFKDLQDNDHVYEVGDKFPHNKRRVSKNRLTELLSSENAIGTPVIEKVEE